METVTITTTTIILGTYFFVVEIFSSFKNVPKSLLRLPSGQEDLMIEKA